MKKRGRIKEVVHKVTQSLYRQVTQIWRSLTENLKLNKIKRTNKNNIYYKETQRSTKKSKMPDED